MCVLRNEAEEFFEEKNRKIKRPIQLKMLIVSSQVSDSHPELKAKNKSQILVCTKAKELIGSLACVHCVYFNGRNKISHMK